MRRAQTRVPNTAQGSLGFTDAAKAGSETARSEKARVGASKFLEATPWHLYVGAERVDQYLKSRGLGWVVKLREELQKVDFSSLELNYHGVGRPPYKPSLMMGLLVYGILKRKSSLREFEELAVADVGAWWICGGLQPDHSTVGDFLARHKEQISKEFFTALVRDLVGRKGITNGVVAGDGTVIEASASRFELLSQEAAAQAAEKAKETAARQTHDEELAHHAQQAQAIAHIAGERAAQQERKGRKGALKGLVVTPLEPDAVVQRCKDGRRRPAYKPSVLVHESGLIVSQVVEPSSESAAIPALLDQHQEVFGAPPDRMLLDAGYHNIEVLGEAAAREIDLLCPSGTTLDGQWQRQGNKGKFGKTDFTYEAQSDRYQCPAGHWLIPGTAYQDTATGQRVRKYRTPQCRGCELRARCTQSATGRAIVRFEGEEIKEIMEEVMAQPRARALYRMRREIVERVFAEFGWRQGLKRFRRKGRSGSGLEFGLHCIAYNLKWAIGRGASGPLVGASHYLARLWRLLVKWLPETKYFHLENALLPVAP